MQDAKIKELIAKEQRKEQIIAQFKPLLRSYAKFVQLDSNSRAMHNAGTEVSKMVLAELKRNYPDDVKVAAAGVCGQQIAFTQDNIGYMMGICFGRGSMDKLNATAAKIKEISIDVSADWILKRRSGIWFIFFGKENVISKEEAIKAIKDLIAESI